MRQKHTVIQHGSLYISFTGFIFLFSLVMMLTAEPEVRFIVPIAMWVLDGVMIVVLRKPICLSLSRVIIDENGIITKSVFRKSVTVRWEDVKHIVFKSYDGGGYYDQVWLCFLCDNDPFPPKVNMQTIPYADECCAYMVYSEFIWEMIVKYANKRVYNTAFTDSREIV